MKSSHLYHLCVAHGYMQYVKDSLTAVEDPLSWYKFEDLESLDQHLIIRSTYLRVLDKADLCAQVLTLGKADLCARVVNDRQRF